MTIRPRPADQDVLMAVVALAFFAGILTVAAPCSLPVLPALLGVSLGQGDKARPVLITMGFVVAFTAAAVFFSVTTQIAGIDQTAVRTAAAVLLAAFGALMLWPRPSNGFGYGSVHASFLATVSLFGLHRATSALLPSALDLRVLQLHQHATTYHSALRHLQGQGPYHRRRPYTRVSIREIPGQSASRPQAPRHPLSGRAGQ